jgi:putative transposase
MSLHASIRTPRRIRQHDLAFRTWGGARRGAGRKRTAARARVPHRTRPKLDGRHPVHATIRLRAGLPNLRCGANRAAITEAFASANRPAITGARFGLRLNQFSLQSNHIHLIVEAGDRRSLSSGMQGLLVRLARALNRLWGRRGPVFSDRFHARALRTPREVRAALLYVLQNARHHGLRILGVDAFSSGPWFDGWRERIAAGITSAVAPARTWLLRFGWRKHGLIRLEESPRSGQPPSRP